MKKRKRDANTASDSEEDTNTTQNDHANADFLKDSGLKPVSGLTLQKETANNNNNQMWLIKAPKNFDLTLLDDITFKMIPGHSKTIVSEDGRKFILTNKGAAGDSIQQVVGFLPTDDAGAMACVPPFAHAIEIVESFTQGEATQNTTFRGVQHQAYRHVPQLPTMGYRLKCAGYDMSSSSGIVLKDVPAIKKRKQEKKKKKKSKKEMK